MGGNRNTGCSHRPAPSPPSLNRASTLHDMAHITGMIDLLILRTFLVTRQSPFSPYPSIGKPHEGKPPLFASKLGQ